MLTKSATLCRMSRVLSFVLLLLTVVPLRADKLEDALSLLWAGKIEQGMTDVRALAEKGDVCAQLFLGHAYANKNSIVRHPDYQEAMKWFKRASSQFSGEGSAGIAELYEQGHGVPKSSVEAKAWWDLAAKQGYDQQELDLHCFVRKSGRGRLTCTPLPDGSGCPTPVEMAALRAAGLTGTLKPTGGVVRHRLGPKARALVILDHRITSEVRLKQPRHTSVIYVQQGTGWLLLPENAPLLDRPIILSSQPDAPQYTLEGVQDVDGSVTSGGCATWK
jgi:Sel1 repeat